MTFWSVFKSSCGSLSEDFVFLMKIQRLTIISTKKIHMQVILCDDFLIYISCLFNVLENWFFFRKFDSFAFVIVEHVFIITINKKCFISKHNSMNSLSHQRLQCVHGSILNKILRRTQQTINEPIVNSTRSSHIQQNLKKTFSLWTKWYISIKIEKWIVVS